MGESGERILIIDDELHVCTGCKRMLESEGYDVAYALSGAKGLEMIEQDEFNLVITDLKMADIDGINMIKTIKTRHPETPVMMITGYASYITAVEAMKLGAEGYLAKQFDPAEIIGTVRKILQKKREPGAAEKM